MTKRVEVNNKTIGLYRMWHKKSPDTAMQATFDFPDVVGVLGEAMRIIYWSDKWEDPGEGHYYEHDFDSSPPVYCQSGDGTTCSVDKILGVPGVNSKQSQWPVLAEVNELSVRLPEGNVKTFRFKRPPLLLCTADKKGLCILYKREPIFIRGGRMRVTSRGIVN